MLVFLGAIAANALNYGFAITMTRVLTPNNYAILITLVSIIMMVSIPFRTATTVAAKYTPYILREYNTYFQTMLIVGICIMGVYMGISPLLMKWLNIPFGAFLGIAPVIMLIPLISMNVGIMEGLRRVRIFSSIPVLESCAKFLLALLLTTMGYAIYGAIGAITIAVLVSCLLNTILVTHEQKNYRVQNNSSHIPDQWKQGVFVILISNIAIALLGNIDILAAKHFLEPQLAAQYSVLTVISRILSYGSLIMLPILFPAMSQAIRPRDARMLLQKGIWVACSASLAILTLFGLYPEHIVKLLPGSQYQTIAPYVLTAGIAATLWSISQLFLAYFIASNTKKFLVPLLGITGLQMVEMTVFHSSIQEILVVITGTQALLLCICTWIFWRYEN